MLISQLLRRKGQFVACVEPRDAIGAVLEQLAEHGVGALVVSANGRTIDGIISERDIVRALALDGDVALQKRASDLMTADVLTCEPDDTTEDLMARMTEHRFRHMPVVDHAGAMMGIVSIGDVVNARVNELETERQQLTDYISGR
ncbi:MAG: CBS domain-containing protein [Acidimicrobiales bacterium]|nr:CBS domain-containing protein [Acidimicrobiales bacterium]